MVERHVMVKLIEPLANDAGRAESAAYAAGALAAIPGVRSVYVGTAATPADAESWDLALVLRFDDVAAVDAYRVDPLHVASGTLVAGPAARSASTYLSPWSPPRCKHPTTVTRALRFGGGSAADCP